MQTQNASDIQFDLTVPPLEHYFGGSSTDMFATNPFFGHATIDPNATLAPPSSPALTVAGSAAAGGGGVSPLSTMSGLMPSQDGSNQILNNDRTRISSFSFAGMDKLFYNGTPSSGDASSLYIQIPQSENEGGVSCGSEFWVSVAWDEVVPKLIDFPDVLKDVMKYISERPDLKDKAIQMMGGVSNLSRANDGGLRSDGTISSTGSSSSLSVPVSATFSSNSSRDSTLSSFSDGMNTSTSGATSPSSVPRPRANSAYLQSPLGSARAGSFSAVS